MKKLSLLLLAGVVLAGCNLSDDTLQIKAGESCNNDGDRINGLECVDGRWVRQSNSPDMTVDLSDARADLPADQGRDVPGDLAPVDMPVDMEGDATTQDMMTVLDMTPDLSMDMSNDMSTQDMAEDMMPDLPPSPRCGDGVVQNQEQCDDGNRRSADGCQETCMVETGWSCPSGGGPCQANCGDGLVVGPETCDDQGLVAGDGCSASCRTEPNWMCINQPSQCTHDTWGNGQLDTGEQCDDGNLTSGDGCSRDARIEPAYICPTVGSLCERVLDLRRTSVQPTSISSYPPHSTGSPEGCRCADGQAFTRGIKTYFSNQNRWNFTAAGCGATSVNDQGGVEVAGGAGVGWFTLPQSGQYVNTTCPSHHLVSKATVHLKADSSEVQGIVFECSRYAILDGTLKKVSTHNQPVRHGITTTNTYDITCPTGQFPFGYEGHATEDYIHRLGFRCVTFSYRTQ